MKKVLEIIAYMILAAGIGVGATLLASWSVYRADVRNCMNDPEQTEASCEAKFK